MARLTDKMTFAIANVVFYAKNTGFVRRYRRATGRLPNISNPQLYSERMLWRKIVDHNPRFAEFSDKLAAKEYVQKCCPELAVPRTLWVGDDAAAIPDELLRGDVYVKANHGCDFNLRIRGGECDRPALREKTGQWLRSVYGQKSGQWGYSRVKPRLFVEEAIGDAETDLIEFNVRACNGRVIMGSVMGHCKTPDQWAVYLDPEGVPTLGMADRDGSPARPLPEGLDLMEPYLRTVQFTRKLSVGVDYARFDFMWNGKELFGGEITVYPAAGMTDPLNSSANTLTLTGWDLRQSHFLKSRHSGWTGFYADALKRHLKERASAPAP